MWDVSFFFFFFFFFKKGRGKKKAPTTYRLKKAVPPARPSGGLCGKLVPSAKPSLVYTPTIHKIRRRALRALFSNKSLQIRGLFLVNKSKEASTCRREAAALTVQCLPRAQS